MKINSQTPDIDVVDKLPTKEPEFLPLRDRKKEF